MTTETIDRPRHEWQNGRLVTRGSYRHIGNYDPVAGTSDGLCAFCGAPFVRYEECSWRHSLRRAIAASNGLRKRVLAGWHGRPGRAPDWVAVELREQRARVASADVASASAGGRFKHYYRDEEMVHPGRTTDWRDAAFGPVYLLSSDEHVFSSIRNRVQAEQAGAVLRRLGYGPVIAGGSGEAGTAIDMGLVRAQQEATEARAARAVAFRRTDSTSPDCAACGWPLGMTIPADWTCSTRHAETDGLTVVEAPRTIHGAPASDIEQADLDRIYAPVLAHPYHGGTYTARRLRQVPAHRGRERRRLRMQAVPEGHRLRRGWRNLRRVPRQLMLSRRRAVRRGLGLAHHRRRLVRGHDSQAART